VPMRSGLGLQLPQQQLLMLAACLVWQTPRHRLSPSLDWCSLQLPQQ
jgi:hypothetical protein